MRIENFRIGYFALLGLVLLSVSVVLVGCGDKSEEAAAQGGASKPALSKSVDSESALQMAPDFQVTLFNGETFELSAYRGQVVLVDFWATWCPPCIAEVPHFNELYADYRSKGFEMIGLSVDQGGARVVEPFLISRGVTYPVAMADDALVAAYGGIRGLPTAFLIDQKGRIAEKFLGYREKHVFETAIERLLAE